MLTFEELRPLLFKYALKHVSKRHEIWDIINGVWAIGRVQNLPSIKMAANRIQWDIISFLRSERNVRKIRRIRARDGFYPYTENMSEREARVRLRTGDTQKLDLYPASPQSINTLLDDEEFDVIVNKCTRKRRHRLYLKMRARGFRDREIAKAIGCTRSSISQERPGIYELFRIAAKHCKYEGLVG